MGEFALEQHKHRIILKVWDCCVWYQANDAAISTDGLLSKCNAQ